MTYRLLVRDETASLDEFGPLTQAGQHVLKRLHAPEGDMAIALVDESRMQELNREYAGSDEATDVLSFSHNEIDSESGRLYLGDIIICLDIARTQAQEAGHPLNAELMLLIVHGILHILGHDHQTEEDSQHMFALQQDLLDMVAEIIE